MAWSFITVAGARLIALAAAFMLVVPAAAGQDHEALDEGSICVGGPRWRPLSSDVARIETVPVPQSLLEVSRTPCASMMRHEVHLIDWHLAFGSERSTAAALEHAVAHYLREAPPPDGYVRELRRAWRAAEPDFRRAASLRQPGDWDEPVRRFLRQSRAYQRLDHLEEAREDYMLLAEQYLRAAEEFGSTILLGKAELFLSAVIEGTRFFAPLEAAGLTLGYFEFDDTPERVDDFRMRLAVLRAQLTRLAADIQSAETLLASISQPSFREAAEHAYEGGNAFCAFGDDERRQPLIEMCEREDQFPGLVTNYLISRTILDFVSGPPGDGEASVFRLLQREQNSSTSVRYGGRQAEEDIRRILLARVASHRREFASKITLPEPYDARDPWHEALRDLERLERMIAPFDEPRRFRLVANAWLELYAYADALDSPDDPIRERSASATRRRYATYLRRLLADLDAVAIGAEGEPR